MPYQATIACKYKNEAGHPCHNWFVPNEEDDSYCPVHAGIIKIDNGAARLPAKNEEYIRARHETELRVDMMNDEQLCEHIAQAERLMERFRMEAIVGRAKQSDRLSNLSDDERRARRKYKVILDEDGNVIPPKIKEAKLDPLEKTILETMKKFKMTREKALKMLED